MDCGMPQGSVAGPVIFTMYSAPIEDIASSNGIECMTYADDTQLHISMNPSNRDVSVSKLEQCLADIKSWTVRNKLQLNDSKTEVIHVTSRNMKTTPLSGIRVGDTNVEPTSSARNLGVILDSQLTMRNMLITSVGTQLTPSEASEGLDIISIRMQLRNWFTPMSPLV
ncbi:putative RNA-directed DNA polymerase from mobile element jockey-like [Apostichopus japonicus]|uniref:Putative RNA-directed DNA polymerase from mobile element jockey-like n=1 Tax=Stichopus japonicus TaxID=307972 RepID=A0A2G8JX96_STIJA|nr:putative RNA-directed DNA polymerase from mobile element jockey-like [Apostichopus japonicus]